MNCFPRKANKVANVTFYCYGTATYFLTKMDGEINTMVLNGHENFVRRFGKLAIGEVSRVGLTL